MFIIELMKEVLLLTMKVIFYIVGTIILMGFFLMALYAFGKVLTL